MCVCACVCVSQEGDVLVKQVREEMESMKTQYQDAISKLQDKVTHTHTHTQTQTHTFGNYSKLQDKVRHTHTHTHIHTHTQLGYLGTGGSSVTVT